MDSEFEELGTQFDGEPAAVVTEETPAESTPEADPKADETAGESTEETSEETAEEAHKKKTGSQRARERAQRLEAENQALRDLLLRQGGNAPEAPKAPAADPNEPKAEDFDSHQDYTRALARHEAQKILQAERAQESQRKAQESWAQKAEAGRAKYEDFDEALQDAPAPSMAVAEALNASPVGGELAYHLATHQDEYRRINALGPVAAARELGLLEAKLSAPSEKQATPKKPTQAPPPAKPVASSAAVPTSHHGGFEEF